MLRHTTTGRREIRWGFCEVSKEPVRVAREPDKKICRFDAKEGEIRFYYRFGGYKEFSGGSMKMF